MGRGSNPIDRSRLRAVPARRRGGRAKPAQEAKPHVSGSDFATFLASLPEAPGANALRAAIVAWAGAWKRGRTVLLSFGAPLVRLGLTPLLIDLMERGAVSAIATHDATCVDDLESALFGRIGDGSAAASDEARLGSVHETADRLNEAVRVGAAEGLGMGESLGQEILEGAYPYAERSLCATAARLGVPITVHGAIGTAVHHGEPSVDAAAHGVTSHRDFSLLVDQVAGLEGGVALQVGGTPSLDDVFARALGRARREGHRVERFTTIVCERGPRPATGAPIADRSDTHGGREIPLVGHFEIQLSLIAAGVIEAGPDRGPRARGDGKRRRPGPGLNRSGRT